MHVIDEKSFAFALLVLESFIRHRTPALFRSFLFIRSPWFIYSKFFLGLYRSHARSLTREWVIQFAFDDRAYSTCCDVPECIYASVYISLEIDLVRWSFGWSWDRGSFLSRLAARLDESELQITASPVAVPSSILLSRVRYERVNQLNHVDSQYRCWSLPWNALLEWKA